VIRIVEGGPEDLDGAVNRRGAVLLGPESVISTPDPTPEENDDGGGTGGGCFLSTVRH
jgi:hypothetical protein